MALLPIDGIPDEARVWIFTARGSISDKECGSLLPLLERFLDEWTSHRSDLNASYAVRYRRFVVVAVDESRTASSGCSIDALFDAMKAIGEAIENPLVDTPDLTWRDGETIEGVDRATFGKLVETGVVGRDTIVFDKTIRTLGDLRHGRWEKPFSESWHSRAFMPGTTTP